MLFRLRVQLDLLQVRLGQQALMEQQVPVPVQALAQVLLVRLGLVLEVSA